MYVKYNLYSVHIINGRLGFLFRLDYTQCSKLAKSCVVVRSVHRWDTQAECAWVDRPVKQWFFLGAQNGLVSWRSGVRRMWKAGFLGPRISVA